MQRIYSSFQAAQDICNPRCIQRSWLNIRFILSSAILGVLYPTSIQATWLNHTYSISYSQARVARSE